MVILSPPIQTQKNVLHGWLYGLGFGFSAKLLVYAVYTDMPYVLLYYAQTYSKLVHSPLPRPNMLEFGNGYSGSKLQFNFQKDTEETHCDKHKQNDIKKSSRGFEPATQEWSGPEP